MGAWLDYTVNGFVIGNIYALLAVGLALIFGVANLINFAQGSEFTVGAYLGWTAIRYLHTPLPITIDVPAERLDRHIEATAYFVGCEGLTNVIKHARASAATLSAVRRNGSLIVTVADDGVGGAAARPGSGLAGLADRVQAVGGQLVVRSDATGTLLTADLPCG